MHDVKTAGVLTYLHSPISVYDIGNGYNNFFSGTGIGDVNGDGLMDFCHSGIRTNYPGYVCIIYGSIPLHASPDVTLWDPWNGTISYTFGWTITPLGDMDKDGFDDFAVTGEGFWPCIYYGGNPMDTIPVIHGDTTDIYTRGDRIANIGDLNHDGWDDFGVGYTSYDFGAGAVFVYFGYREMNSEIDLTLFWYDTYPYTDLHFGEDVGAAGDFNGDGVDDMAVSGKRLGPDGITHVYVYAGSSELPTDADEFEEVKTLPPKYDFLYQNYPNPFNSETTIRYSLHGHSERKIDLSIYNMLGEKIRTLSDRVEGGGVHTAIWDGTDDNDETVASGVYFYILKSDDETLSRKLMLVK